MNKLYLVIVVLFSLGAHHINWGMLTVAQNKTQMRPLKSYWTPEKIDKESQNFLSSFGEHSLSKTGLDFCNLPMDSKVKVLSRLSYNQKLFVWFGAQGLDIPILTVLCNGNENVAHMYRNESINKALEDSVRAEEWPKFGKMSKHHFMPLKNSEIRLFQDVLAEGVILQTDVPKFMDALQKLKKVEPEFDTKVITDFVKIYPPFKDQALFFWNEPLPFVAYKSKMVGLGAILLDRMKVSFLNSLGIVVSPQASGPLLLALGLTCCLDLCYKYLHSHAHIKNNILTNQPTLTDYFKEHGFNEFANK